MAEDTENTDEDLEGSGENLEDTGEDLEEIGEGGFGIELDKLEVPLSKDKPEQTPDESDEPEPEPVVKVEKKKKKSKILPIVAAVAIAAVLLFLSLQMLKANINKELFNYRKFGPITANLDEERYVKLSFRVGYRPEFEEQISAMEPLFRSRIIEFLRSREAEVAIKKKNLIKTKTYLKAEISRLVMSDYVSNIRFLELRVY